MALSDIKAREGEDSRRTLTIGGGLPSDSNVAKYMDRYTQHSQESV